MLAPTAPGSPPVDFVLVLTRSSLSCYVFDSAFLARRLDLDFDFGAGRMGKFGSAGGGSMEHGACARHGHSGMYSMYARTQSPVCLV
jgi:hypothetical protein